MLSDALFEEKMVEASDVWLAILAWTTFVWFGVLSSGMQNYTWYSVELKPRIPLSPPGWVFGPVWAVLYTLLAAAGVLAWLPLDDVKQDALYNLSLVCMAVNVLINKMWTPVFFGLRRLWIAAALIVGMILSTAAAGVLLWMRWDGWASIIASFLLLPYFLWISFAMYLNVRAAMLYKRSPLNAK